MRLERIVCAIAGHRYVKRPTTKFSRDAKRPRMQRIVSRQRDGMENPVKRYNPVTEYRMGSVFAGMEIDAEGEYVRHADAAILIDALQRLSEFFIGEWVNDERGQDDIDNEREAAEGFAKDVLAKLSPLTANT